MKKIKLCPSCNNEMYFDNVNYTITTAVCPRCRFIEEAVYKKDLESSWKYFNELMIILSRSFSHSSLIPKKPYIIRCFFLMNDGIGFTSLEVEKILCVVKNYFYFLTISDEVKFKNNLPYQVLLNNTIIFLNINKRFKPKINRRLILWDEFTLYFQSRISNLLSKTKDYKYDNY